MKRWSPCSFTLVVSVVMAIAAPAFGFGFGGGGGDMPQDMWGGAAFKPVVGQWAEYLMTAKNEDPMTMRIAVVGEEDGAFWYETKMLVEDQDQMISKMLVSGDPSEEGNIERLIIKGGDDPAMEMPVGDGGPMTDVMGFIGQGEEEVEEEEVGDIPTDLGMESVTVPAGTFKARHWRVEDEEFWFDMWQAENVGPYGLVKSMSDDFEMVLTDHGDGAKSEITEEPEKLEIPSFSIPGFGG